MIDQKFAILCICKIISICVYAIIAFEYICARVGMIQIKRIKAYSLAPSKQLWKTPTNIQAIFGKLPLPRDKPFKNSLNPIMICHFFLKYMI